MFKNRTDAGSKIAKHLMEYAGENTVVYAIPRGGVIVGRAVADELGSPLDLVVTRKLVFPDDPNHAFGAVDELGNQMIDEMEAKHIAPEVMQAEIQRQKIEIARRAQLYRAGKDPLSCAGKIAIIVDDSITTGYNILPAVELIKSQKPKKVIVAIPLAPRASLEKVRSIVDQIVILVQPEAFGGSADTHYIDFVQPTDAEIISALKGPKKKDIHRPFKADIDVTEPGREPFFTADSS